MLSEDGLMPAKALADKLGASACYVHMNGNIKSARGHNGQTIRLPWNG